MKSRLVLTLVLLIVPFAVIAAEKQQTPETLLRALYAAHQPWKQKDALTDQSLPKYFDANLVKQILADRHCSAPDWGVGNLDFDPVLNAQDFGDNGIGDLKIRRLDDRTAEKWQVSFLLFPGVSKERTTLVYRLVQSSGAWRISDIDYGDFTLLKILAPPCK